jgi:2-C-methyl-D-erythritol 4-phosphate cytidylyltransferase
MGGKTPKQFVVLGGLPLLAHTLAALDAADSVTAVIVAAPEADLEFTRREIVSRYAFKKVTKIVPGGAERQDSVRHALDAAGAEAEIIVVHDAVRPFLTASMVEAVVARAAERGAALVAIPMRDTVKQVGADGLVTGTVDRGQLWLAQTPQAFRRGLLEEAHRKALLEGFRATDDAQLVERLGHRVAIVEGSSDNIKITRPEDLAMGEAILTARSRVSRRA